MGYTLCTAVCTILLAISWAPLTDQKDTIDFLCLTCDEDSTWSQCCQNGLGLDYCCSVTEKGGDFVGKAADGVLGFIEDKLGVNTGGIVCRENSDCAEKEDAKKFCCWGGSCCTAADYLEEGFEAFFRSFGGYVIGTILLCLLCILFLSCCISICCCICRKR